MATQATSKPEQSIPAFIAAAHSVGNTKAATAAKDQFGNHDPDELEISEMHILRLFQSLRRTDPHDIAEGVTAITVFVASEGLAETTPLYMAAFKAADVIKPGAAMATIFDAYEILLQMISQYVYCFEEDCPAPLGSIDGLAYHTGEAVAFICVTLGFWDWCGTKPANYWRDQYKTLSSTWTGAVPVPSKAVSNATN